MFSMSVQGVSRGETHTGQTLQPLALTQPFSINNPDSCLLAPLPLGSPPFPHSLHFIQINLGKVDTHTNCF